MSETNNSTNEPVLDAGNVVGTRPNILSLVSLSGEDEPTGFALLMTPYKAKLLDVELLIGSLARTEQETRGKITPQDREILITNIKESLTAADLLLKSNLYTTRQVNDRENVPRIVFPLPLDIRDQLLVSYQTSDMGVSGALASFGSDLAKNIKQGRGLDLGADTMSSALSALALNALKNTSAAPLAGQYFGAIANPFTVTAFRNVEPRMFNFEFRITPANQKQSETLQECINTLRYCALPDPTASGVTLDIPYRFKLAWLGGLKMFDFSEAVLTRIEVNYSSGGSPAFFEFTESSVGGSPGYHPVAVTVALEFRELFPLTKETIIPSGGKPQTYDGEMFPRKIGRDQFNDRRIPASSPETQGGSTTTDAAENQTGTADNALNTPVNNDAATIKQAQDIANASGNQISFLGGVLKNEGEGGADAFRAEQGLIPSTEVYLTINEYDTAVNSYNDALEVLKSSTLSNDYVKDIPNQQTWLEKVESGKSGSKSGINIWERQYDKGSEEWNKTDEPLPSLKDLFGG